MTARVRNTVDRVRSSSAGEIIGGIANERGKVSVRILNFVLLPGVVLRIGLRELAALLLRVRAFHFGMSQAPGGHVVVEDETTRWKRVFIILGVPLLLIPLGALISSQIILDQVTIQSYLPFPETFDTEGYTEVFAESLVRFSDGELLRIWVTISCWFMVLIPHSDFMRAVARTEASEEAGWRSLPMILRPFAAVSWVIAKAGVLAGVLTVVLSLGLSATIIRNLAQWRLGL